MPTTTRIGTMGGVALRERLDAPLKILAVVKTLGRHGVEASALLAGSGSLPTDVSRAHTRTSIAQFLVVCRNAARLSPDPAWGVAVGSEMHLTSYGMYGYALACADSLRRTTEFALRYHRLATPVMKIELVEDQTKAAWVFPRLEETDLPDVDQSLFRSLLEMQIFIHATLTREVIGLWCVPARALFALPRPRHADTLVRGLECPVEFDQPRTELHYPIEWLQRTPQFANPITAEQVSATCET
jgi:Arabinose-binding domain of AraC transcription regulator, N-term